MSRPEASSPAKSYGACLACLTPLGKPGAYCNRQCWADHQVAKVKAATVPCAVCGMTFYRPPAHTKRAEIGATCSRACWRKQSTGTNNPAFQGGKITMACGWCQKPVEIKKGRRDKFRACSPSCATNLMWKASPRKLTMVNCPECGTLFKPNTKAYRFCGPECRAAKHSREMTGEGNGRYVHGQAASPYPKGWTVTFRSAIRARDGNTCRLCFMAAADHGKALCVHHIDYQKANLDPANLITLCRFCHGKMHGKPKQRAEWQGRLSAVLTASASTAGLPTTSA